MKKKLAIIIGVLVVIVGITAYLNMKNAQPLIALEKNAEFMIKESGNEAATFNMEQIRKMGETDFKGNLKKKGQDPIEYTYTGVLLKKIIEQAGIVLEGKSSVVVTAVDGYTVAYDIEKVKADDNIYLGYIREGEAIGSKNDSGSGPFMVIVSKDKFSQHWCKYAVEVNVE